MTTFTENVATGSSLKPVNVADKVFRGYKEDNRFKHLMGSVGGESGVINVKMFEKGDGDTFKFPFTAGVALSSWLSGTTVMEDTGTALAKTTDSLTIGLKRVPILVNGVTMSQQRTTFDLIDSDTVELKRSVGEKMEDVIMASLLDTSAGRVQQRYRYGADDSNYNATEATAKGNVDATDDKLTLDNIADLALMAKRKTVSGGLKMTPYMVKGPNGNMERRYIYLAHPLAIRDLKRSANFLNQIIYKDRPEYDLIAGADYIGQYEGVMIYEFNNDTMLEATAGAGGIQIAHNFLLGQNAVGVGFGKVELSNGTGIKKVAGPEYRGVMTMMEKDHGQKLEIGFSMVTGAKQLCEDTSGTSQAYGTIHHYTAAVE
ncbi:DUF4043 family protein [Mesorhizobium sp. B2-3-4]|uniref:phage capsid family protein n=1 Tax=Mesorhizobium sp. B2-3-4 TaxID=2589959 RepID=UPI00112B49D6|nr:DUF4043 family protein [Mesorhizobium sp. B2-3-4]TPM41416.1 DUF4043 family protein [Mesorhizobium sp. B2-3-4]